jgi:hypothetical protein
VVDGTICNVDIKLSSFARDTPWPIEEEPLTVEESFLLEDAPTLAEWLT